MSWLAKIGPFRKGGTAVAEAFPEGGIGGVSSGEAGGPPLICLVTDASGTASYKRHVFSDIESATDFVLYWFPNQNEGGIISFWAMTYQPSWGFDSAVETVAEPLVMIRDHVREEIVYLFSFTDIESAQAFLREEVRRGIDLGAMMLYWAVPVRMAADPWGKMTLTPSVAPGTEGHEALATPHMDMWTPPPAAPVFETPQPRPADDSRAIFEEAPNAHTGVAEPIVPGMETFELTSWMDRPRDTPDKDKKTAAQLREWLARQEVAAAEPPVETRRELPVVPTDETPDVAVSEPLVEVAASPVKGEVATTPTWTEEPAQITEQVAETAFVTEPVEEAPAEAQMIIAEVVEATVEPEPEAVVEPEPVAEAPAEEAPDEAQMIIAEAVEAAVEPEPEAVDEPEPIAASSAFEPSAPFAAHEADTAHEESRAQAMAPDGTSEPEIQRATIRVHTNGNGHMGDYAKRRDSKEQDVSPEEAGAAVHENGNGHEAPRSQAYIRTPEVEYTNGNGDHPEPSVDIRIEIHLESSRALKVKRWEKKEKPFDGFDSPPGRF